MVQQAPPSFCVGLHHTRAEGGGVPGGCFSRVTLSVKAGKGQPSAAPLSRPSSHPGPSVALPSREAQRAAGAPLTGSRRFTHHHFEGQPPFRLSPGSRPLRRLSEVSRSVSRPTDRTLRARV